MPNLTAINLCTCGKPTKALGLCPICYAKANRAGSLPVKNNSFRSLCGSCKPETMKSCGFITGFKTQRGIVEVEPGSVKHIKKFEKKASSNRAPVYVILECERHGS